MIAYRPAVRTDIPSLTKLWQLCFGDETDQIESFWTSLFPQIRVFCATDGQTPVAFLCALPTTLVDDCGAEHPSAYLYAVCTAPTHRRRGISRSLMSFAEEALQKMGYRFALLVPAEEALFDFYAKLGYQTACYHKAYTATAQASSTKVTPVSADAYRNLRQMQLYGSAVTYPLFLLEWQAAAGGLYRVETADAVCCIAAEKHGRQCVCKEVLPDCPEAAAALAAKLGCETASVRTEGLQQPFGMIKALSGTMMPDLVYLGLAFD